MGHLLKVRTPCHAEDVTFSSTIDKKGCCDALVEHCFRTPEIREGKGLSKSYFKRRYMRPAIDALQQLKLPDEVVDLATAFLAVKQAFYQVRAYETTDKVLYQFINGSIQVLTLAVLKLCFAASDANALRAMYASASAAFNDFLDHCVRFLEQYFFAVHGEDAP